MRQTNNALTFLSASYQAVFKHAYVTGLASSAVMLTLASPYALASVAANWDESNLESDTSFSDINLASEQDDTTNYQLKEWSGDIFNVNSGSETRISINKFNKLNIDVAAHQGQPNEGLTLKVSSVETNPDTAFFAKDAIIVNNGYLKAAGNDTHFQLIQASADENSGINGDLTVSGGLIELNKAVMSVNNADIYNSTIKIKGLIGTNGNTTSDLLVNYSSLNTGMGSSSVGTAKIERTDLTLGNQGAFNAVGSVTIPSNGSITFQGENSNQAVKHSLGEIAAKAIFSAQNATLNTNVVVNQNHNGAFFVENLTLNKGSSGANTINGSLQFAGQLSYTDMDGQSIERGYSGSDTSYLNTNFASGTLNLNLKIDNNGELTFGANSIAVTIPESSESPTLTATPSKYEVTNSSVITNKTGTLNIGEALAEGLTINSKTRAGDGTVFNNTSSISNNKNAKLLINTGAQLNLNAGALNNSGTTTLKEHAALNLNGGTLTNSTSGTIELNSNSTITVNSGTFNNSGTLSLQNQSNGSTRVFSNVLFNGGTLQNSGTINVAGNLKLLEGTTLIQSESSSINLQSSGVLTVDADVLRDQGTEKEQIFDYVNGKYRTKGDLAQGNNINFSGGSLYLSNGIFEITDTTNDSDSLASKILSALSGGKPWSGGVYLNDAILKLNHDLNISQSTLSTNRFGGKVVDGINQSTLYTTGTLNFTTLQSGSTNFEIMNGLEVVGGAQVVINKDKDNSELIIKGKSGSNTTLLATSSLEASEDISVQNFKLKLSNEQMLFGAKSDTTTKSSSVPDFSSASGSINTSINLQSGSSLEIDAGSWTSTENITASANALINIQGQVKDATNENINTNASLNVKRLTLSGSSQTNVSDFGALTAQESITINNAASLNINNNSQLTTKELTIAGDTSGLTPTVSFNNASGELGNVSIETVGELNAFSSALKIGDMLLSGSANAYFNNTPLNVDTLTLNAGDQEHGLNLSNSAFSANTLNISGGHLSSSNDTAQNFAVNGDINITNSALLDLSNVTLNANKLTISKSGQVELEQVTATLNNDLTLNDQNGNSHSKLTLSESKLSLAGNLINKGHITLNNSDLELTGSEAKLQISSAGSLKINSGSLTAQTLELDTNGKLDAALATITAQTIKGKDSAQLTFNNSQITINGDNNNQSLDIGGNITINGGELNLGDAQDSLALTYDKDQGFIIGGGQNQQAPENDDESQLTNNIDFTPIKVGQGAIIKLNISDIDGTKDNLTLSQAKELSNKLISGNGLVRFEGQIQPVIDSSYNDNLERHEVDFADIGNLDLNFSTDVTREAVLTNVSKSGTVSGEWRAIETANGVNSFNVGSANKDMTLSILGTAGGNSNNLAQDKNGNAVGVVLSSGSTLNLQAIGNIGSIIENNESLSSSLNIAVESSEPNATVNVMPLEGESSSEIKVGSLVSNAMVNVQNVIANQANFTKGGLNSDQVSIQGALTAQSASFTAKNDFTAQSISGTGNSIKAQNISFEQANMSSNYLVANQTLKLGQAQADKSIFSAQTLSASSLSGTGNTIQATDIDFGNTNLSESTLTSQTLNITGAANFDKTTITAQQASFTGSELNLNNQSQLKFTGDIQVDGKVQVLGGSVLTAKHMQLGSGDLYVGSEDVALSDTSSTGKVVLKSLDLNGNNLVLDPEFGQAAATMFVNNIGDASDINSGRYNTKLTGNIIVGRNSALGIGGTEEEFNSAIAKYQESSTGSFKSDDIGAMLYVNRSNIQLAGNKLLISTEDIADLKKRLEDESSATIYLGQNSGLQVTARALNEAKATTTGQIFSDLDQNDVIESTNGTLILPSGVTMDELKAIFGSDVTLAENSEIKVTTENGLFHGVIDSTEDLRGDGDFKLEVDKNARTILKDVSTPTFNYYINAMGNSGLTSNPDTDTSNQPSVDENLPDNNENAANQNPAEDSNNAESNTQSMLASLADNPDDPNGSGVDPLPKAGSGFVFLSQAGSEQSGRAIEQSARLASFGMSMQIASQAGNTTSNAIAQRLHMQADNHKAKEPSVLSNGGTSVWFSPVYQNYSSSSFSANDLNYGTDFDLYGAAIGLDHSFNNGLQIGGIINFGQGQADGNGIANGVTNDFDYYGLGLFASFKPLPDLTLSADATYTMVNNDIEAQANVSGYNKIHGTVDSDALSLGINAQYEMQALGVNIKPHAGLRYTNMSVDSYTIKVDGQRIGQTSSDSANILSVPVGIALSSEFKAGDWVVQPRADFKLTANFGSESVGSQTSFDGISGNVNYNTEFIDRITYGVDAGLQISRGNFSFGANAGYTGSSNTNELNVGANVMFKF